MAITYLAGADSNAATGRDGSTTATFDSTGADLIVVSVGWYNGSFTVSDNKTGNTYTALTSETGATDVNVQLYYCVPVDVGTGHTVTVSGTDTYSALNAQAFSGASATPFDLESAGGFANSATSVQPGSATPSENDCLLVTGVGFNNSYSSLSVDSSFVNIEETTYAASWHSGISMAHKIQTTAGAENPTWSWTTSRNSGAVLASFKALSATPTGSDIQRLYRLGERFIQVYR